jgi:hypothetical protein
MSDLSPLSGQERKSNFRAVRFVDDPKQTLLAAASANAALPLTQSYDKVLDCSRPA